MDERNEKYLLALHALNGINSAQLGALMTYFEGDAAEIWHNEDEWRDAIALTEHDLKEIVAEKQVFDIEQYYQTFKASGASYVTIDDDDYPESLRNIYDVPYLLFYKGTLPAADERLMAIVGTRTCTDYGCQTAYNISKDLSFAGFGIVSGMARGLDTQGHLGALAAKAKTYAVLGCGVDVIYPAESTKLYADIVANGAVISEYPLGTPPNKRNFPHRNRLISGLAMALLIVEAGERSGTSITAGHALEQGKEVFAVPGPVMSSASVGTHKMIRSGTARLVTSADDILEDLGLAADYSFSYEKEKVTVSPFDASPEAKLAAQLMTVPRHVNELVREMNMSTAEVLALLAVWEMRGLINALPGQYFVISGKNS